MSELWTDPNVDPEDMGNGPGFFSRLRHYMIGPVAALGLCLSVWYLIIPGMVGILYIDALDHEIPVENYAQVRAMDNHVTHEYIVKCLRDGVITRSEYRNIRNLTEKYPVIERITKE